MRTFEYLHHHHDHILEALVITLKGLRDNGIISLFANGFIKMCSCVHQCYMMLNVVLLLTKSVEHIIIQ